MPLPIKPDHYINWTDGASQKQIEPTSGKKLLGWTATERPAFQFMNWLFWWTDQWIKYLDALTIQTSTAAGVSAATTGHIVATGANVQLQLDELDAAVAGISLTQKPLAKVSATVYQLPTTPTNAAAIIVLLDGVIDDETEWTYDQINNQIDFTVAPSAGQVVEAIYLTGGTGAAAMGSAYAVYGSPGSPLVLNPAVPMPIAAVARQLRFVVSQGGQQTLSGSPLIQAGTMIGQELCIIGTSDSNDDIIPDAGGTGVFLNGTIDLKNHKAITLIWDSVGWVEISRR